LVHKLDGRRDTVVLENRRVGERRTGTDRRQQQSPVAVERRSGLPRGRQGRSRHLAVSSQRSSAPAAWIGHQLWLLLDA
jgi:hypothetical protein